MKIEQLKLHDFQYKIAIGTGLLSEVGSQLTKLAPHRTCGVIIDSGLPAHLKNTLLQGLEKSGYETIVADFTPTEKSKSLDSVAYLLDIFLANNWERRAPIISFGGGITTDVGGFVAASLLRGVPHVNISTTLLGMVDASIGGKTGVNAKQGKNLIGAFYQPVFVCCDTDVLKTLPMRQLRGGLAECVKHAWIREPERVAWLTQQAADIFAHQDATLEELVAWNVAIKARVVEADQQESDLRMHLNLGHTFCHALERFAWEHGYDISHGEAVAMGLRCAHSISVARGWMSAKSLAELITCLEACKLPTQWPFDHFDLTALCDYMLRDKKVRDGKVQLVLLHEKDGVRVVQDASADELHLAWQSIQ